IRRRRRHGGLEDPELLALLAALHVRGHGGLQALGAVVPEALRERSVLARQRVELLGDARRLGEQRERPVQLALQTLELLRLGLRASLRALGQAASFLLCSGKRPRALF